MFRCLLPLPQFIQNVVYSKNTKTNEKDLMNVEYNDTIEFIAPIQRAKVIKVYDGDTITVAAHLTKDLPIYRFHVRLNGIDAPEIKAKTMKEKEMAVGARDALANMIMGQMIELKNNKCEKYGRILSDVYYGDIHVNQWMLDNRLAIPYDGKTKMRPDEWN